MGATDKQQREQQQRPETPEQKRRREDAIARAAVHERKAENARILHALRSDPHLWAFAEQTARIVARAQDVGGNGVGEELPIGPLTAPKVALCDRVKACRRLVELVEEGASYVIVPQYGPALKEDAR